MSVYIFCQSAWVLLSVSAREIKYRDVFFQYLSFPLSLSLSLSFSLSLFLSLSLSLSLSRFVWARVEREAAFLVAKSHSIWGSVRPSIYVFSVEYTWLYKWLLVCPSICPSVRPSVCPSVRPSVCSSIHPSVRPSVRHAVQKHTGRRFNFHHCPCPWPCPNFSGATKWDLPATAVF